MLALTGLPTRAHALMAGQLPDTPAARVDRNSGDSPWAGVGSITHGGGIYTGTLIGRRHVLTAAHAVPAQATDADVRFNLNYGGDLTWQIQVSHIYRHPAYTGFRPDHPAHDLAILELAREVPPGIPVYAMYEGLVPMGTALTLVGYGASGSGTAGPTVASAASVKRVGANAADAFEGGQAGDPAIYLFDFDGQPGGINLLGGATLGNQIETSLASGDSGGPAFIKDRGRWKIVAVNTFVRFLPAGERGIGRFGTIGGGQLVHPELAWIRAILASGRADSARPGTAQP